jgi:FkbM family methyltransferase
MNRAAKLLSILAVPDYRFALLRHGVAAGVEHGRALEGLPLRTVVDIGANRGQFSLFVVHAFPGVKVTAFEPLRAPAARYRRALGGECGVTLQEVAIGPQAGEAVMHVAAHDDSSSLLPITARQSTAFPGTREVGAETVRLGRLCDSMRADDIERPALIKLDVQGYELSALEGCEELLHCFDWVYAECSFREFYEGQALAEDLVCWLSERGFGILDIGGITRDKHGRALQADLLFGRRSGA